MDVTLAPLERVYRIGKSIFALRYWRYWMSCDNVYPLSNHFITPNAYLCIELNGHALVILIVKLSRDGTPQLFKPWLCGSQSCESFFKIARSMTPVGVSTQLSTQLVFALFDFIYCRCRKADVSSRVTAQGHSEGIVYPRHVKNLERCGGSDTPCFVSDSLPSLAEIKSTMEKQDAKAAMNALGVHLDDPDDRVFSFDPRLAAKLANSFESPPPTDDDANEFEACEEVEYEGEDPLDSNLVDAYEQSLLKSISNAQIIDYSSLLEKLYCEIYQ